MIPHLAVLLATLTWATTFVPGKIIVAAVPVPEAVAVRTAVGALILWAVAIASRRALTLGGMGWRVFFTGMVEPGLIGIIVYTALKMTSAVHATTLFALLPLLNSLLGRLALREPISAPVMAGALVALVGTIVLMSGSAQSTTATLEGDLVMAVAIVLIGLAQVVLRRVAQVQGNPVVVGALLLTGATVAAFLYTAVVSGPDPFTWTADIGTDVWIALLYVAIFVSAANHFLYNYALRHIPMGRISLYFVLVAPLGVPPAAWLLGEPVTPRDILAIALIVSGVALPILAGLRRGAARIDGER
jgi:drug/metabolite transporter (DMT)-like permease